MRHTPARVLAVATFAALLFAPITAALLVADQKDSASEQRGRDSSQGPRLLSTHLGLTPGQWLAVWWQEVFSIAMEDQWHPLTGGGAFGGENRTMFLGARPQPLGSARSTIRITIPAETHLVVPIITVECSTAEEDVFHGDDEAELRACATGHLDGVSSPVATIDGTPVEIGAAHRVESPLFRYGPLTAGNVLGLSPGTQADAVGVGYVLLLPPFSPGVHRVRIAADVVAFGLAGDTEFIITVAKPRPR